MTENNELTFLAWHKPGILPGEYSVQVTQTIVADKIPADDPGFGTPGLVVRRVKRTLCPGSE